MNKYKVNVNGTDYEVAIELIDEATAKAAAPAPKAAAPAAAAPADGQAVTAPMPGPILDIKVAQGATVKKGDVIMILEAMKMENEILAPCDGTVVSLNVQKGSQVDSGSVLCVIK
ncbi:MAG: biotin/lipoyl-binding protein [Lachnospiraceae bacterium]|nr:biotin/lipoyl-binding protein [Lachnospiraceae bacterium]